MSLPVDRQARKNLPVCRGVLDYFPDALAAVADVSRLGNEQHNPGQPLHWERSKSTDHADCIVRHLIERGTIDTDGARHSAKVAWRALALLQTEIEAAAAGGKGTGRCGGCNVRIDVGEHYCGPCYMRAGGNPPAEKSKAK